MPHFIPQNPKQALILLHGYGSNGDDMLSLGKELNLSDTLILSPDAPISLPWGGFAWFPLDDFNLNDLRPDYATSLTQSALPMIKTIQLLITNIQSQYHIESSHILIGGFSQGGLIALLTALLTPDIPLAIGMSAVPLSLQGITICNKPKVILTHGAQDFVVPPAAFQFGLEQLKSHGIPVSTFISQNCEHGVDIEILSYLKSALAG